MRIASQYDRAEHLAERAVDAHKEAEQRDESFDRPTPASDTRMRRG